MKKTIQQRIVLPVLRTRQQVNKWSPACKKWVRRAYKGASWVVTDFSRFDYSALFREDGLWRNLRFCSINTFYPEVPRWLNGEESSCQAGDPGLITESGTSPRERNGNPLQYSCLGNPMDRGAWRATVYGVTKNRTWLSTHACLLFRSYTRAREDELRIWADQMNDFRGFNDSRASFCSPAENRSPTESACFLLVIRSMQTWATWPLEISISLSLKWGES